MRALFQTDRVIVFRFNTDWDGVVEAELVVPKWIKTLGMTIQDECLGKIYSQNYHQGRISTISNIHTANIDLHHRELLSDLQVRANLVVPILQDENLWGC